MLYTTQRGKLSSTQRGKLKRGMGLGRRVECRFVSNGFVSSVYMGGVKFRGGGGLSEITLLAYPVAFDPVDVIGLEQTY